MTDLPLTTDLSDLPIGTLLRRRDGQVRKLEVLAERMFGVPKGLDIMLTETPPIELFQRTRYKIEARLTGFGWSTSHALGDLRFITEAEAKAKCIKDLPIMWSLKELRVVIAND